MSLLPDFSHIYIEEAARTHRVTEALCARFPRATLVPIEHYKSVFNRPRQNWRLQKESLKLILAVKRDKFLYPGTHVMPDFGFENFYYTNQILNCLYDCQYCFLQGMYPTANVVIFVNNEDFFAEVDAKLQNEKPLYLCVSYDSDLLGFERIVPFCRDWIYFAQGRADLLLEIRTKSGNFEAIADCPPCANVILAWTLSPAAIIEKFEQKTASLEARLRSAAKAIACGWRVRVCVDPILPVAGWEDVYAEFAREVSQRLRGMHDLSVGVFRISEEQFKRAGFSKELRHSLEKQLVVRDGLVTLPAADAERIVGAVTQALRSE